MKKNILSKIIFLFKTIIILILLFILSVFCFGLYNTIKTSNNISNTETISKIKDIELKSKCEETKEELFLDFAMYDLYKNRYKAEEFLDKIKSNCMLLTNICSNDIRVNEDSYSTEYIEATSLIIKECLEFESVKK